MRCFSRCLLVVGFALLIFGAKLWIINIGGSDLPVLDQWDAEFDHTLRPWLDGTLDFRELAFPHNEHRLITTKIFVLLLNAANGQWDGLVDATASAVVHTCCALALLWFGGLRLRGRWLIAYAALLVALFSLPYSWENTIVGFQAQFYFLLLFSLLHIVFVLDAEGLSWKWVCGQLCGILALITMASGFLSSAAILIGLGLRFAWERRFSVLQVCTAVIALGAVIAGWLMKTVVPGHAVLKAHNLTEFCWRLLQLLAFPGNWFLPIVLLPAIWFLARTLRCKKARSHENIAIFALLGWIFLQCAALAYARGSGVVLSSRYLDLLALNVALSLVLLATLFTGWTRRIFFGVWLAVVAPGLWHHAVEQWVNGLKPLIPMHRVQIEHVREYLRTSNPASLQYAGWPEIPYPNAAVLRRQLDQPLVRPILPPSVRDPVAVAATHEFEKTPPALIPAPNNVAFSSYDMPDPIDWRSPQLPATTLPFVRLRVAGDLGRSDALALTVKSAEGDVHLMPDISPGARWKPMAFMRPRGKWWIEASDSDPKGWFAFTEPVELGRLRWPLEKLLKHHCAVIVAGVIFILVGATLTMIATNRTDRTALRP
jgi:hypothetical protein